MYSGVENTTISANLTTSKSTNVIPAANSHNRTRLTLTNSSHCIENCTGPHLENEVTATPSKITPSNPIRRPNTSNRVRGLKIQLYELI